MRRPSLRRAEGVFVLEGAKLVSVALEAGSALEGIYVAPGALDPPAERGAPTHAASRAVLDQAQVAGVRVHALAEGVMERLADTTTPQPVMAVARMVDVPLEALSEATLVVVCAGVRDPGNAGTVLRSAEAAGADGVVFCHGSVDLYNPKTVRASAGALFHLGVVAGGEAVEVLEHIGSWGARRLSAVARDGDAYTRVDLRGRVAVVLGNEAQGLDAGLARACDQAVTIPMQGRAESLNVGVAAALICFEAARQRAGPAVGEPGL